MMGSGKTSVGRRLAARLAWRFADSDQEVEQAAGLPVAELFAAEGETGFRTRERDTIASLLGGEPLVLATGGGAMAHAETQAILLGRAVTVWLDAAPEVLAARLAGVTDRPLLRNGDPAAILARLAAERATAYARAHLRLATDGLTPDEVADRLVKMIQAKGRAA